MCDQTLSRNSGSVLAPVGYPSNNMAIQELESADFM